MKRAHLIPATLVGGAGVAFGLGGGEPARATVVSDLMVVVDVGSGPAAGVEDATLSLCLTSGVCYELSMPAAPDLVGNRHSVYHLVDVEVPDVIDAVSLTLSGETAEAFTVEALQVFHDDSSVYCHDAVATVLGGAGGVTAWEDPFGVTTACDTVWPDPITHGPIIGSVRITDARLWARTDGPREVEVRYWPTGATSRTRTVTLQARQEDDFTVTPVLIGLTADREFTAELVVDGVVEPQHLVFRTPPPPTTPVKASFGFGSCARNTHQLIFKTIIDFEPDFFLMLGDNHYGDTTDLNSLLYHYRWSRERQWRLALFQTTPTLAIWDDHDFGGNDAEWWLEGADGSLEVFKDWWPNPSFGEEDNPGVYFTWSYGDLQFFFLDVRMHRGREGTMLGEEQESWLKRELLASTATFKFLVSGSQWSEYGRIDSWWDFIDDRDDLFNWLASAGITGVTLLSGDEHRAEFRNIQPNDVPIYPLPELSSSPLDSSHRSCTVESETVDCFDTSNYFMMVEVDSTLKDPTWVARIYDQAGVLQGTWSRSLSQLQ